MHNHSHMQVSIQNPSIVSKGGKERQDYDEIPEMVSDEEEDEEDKEYQKKQDDMYNSFYVEMRDMNDNYAAMDTENSRLSINHENKEEKAELFKTLSVQAIDEMFIMVTIVCTTIEMFF